MIDETEYKIIISTNGRYEINNNGDIRSTKTKQKMHQSKAGAGYLRINAWINKKHITKYVHRLVAEIFIGSCPNNMEVNHIDGNKLNNNVSNIEYISHSENLKHAIKIGIRKPSHISRNVGENHGLSKLTNNDVIEMRRLWDTGNYTQSELSKTFGINFRRVSCIVRGDSWKHLYREVPTQK